MAGAELHRRFIARQYRPDDLAVAQRFASRLDLVDQR
jgi:hypothetical protein